MNRWILAALLACATLLAQAQVIRHPPADVRPAYMVVTAPPEITLDGEADRLSPGSRIRGINNLLVLSGSVVGQKLPVLYRRDAAGLVHEVWVLTEEEYAQVKREVPDGTAAANVAKFLEFLVKLFAARVGLG